MKAEKFPQAMDRQIEKFINLFEQITVDDFANKKVTSVWEPNNILGAVLMDTALKVVTVYRMQLFLYVKLCGANVNTANCWSGIDWS